MHEPGFKTLRKFKSLPNNLCCLADSTSLTSGCIDDGYWTRLELGPDLLNHRLGVDASQAKWDDIHILGRQVT